MLRPWRRSPHVYIFETQLTLCTDVDSQCCTSTDPDLSSLVVTASFESKQQARVHVSIEHHQLAPSAHVGSGASSVSIHSWKRSQRDWRSGARRPGARRAHPASEYFASTAGQGRHHSLNCIVRHETDAANLNNAVLSTADKKLSSSLYYVLGLTMMTRASRSRQHATWQSGKARSHFTRRISRTSTIVTRAC